MLCERANRQRPVASAWRSERYGTPAYRHLGPAPELACRRMATAATEQDRCAVCRRHFLLGEAIRLYREPSSRGTQRVCPLCAPNAVRRGWELVEATRTQPLRIHGDPAYMERAVQRDRLVERLNEQREGLQDERQRERRAAEAGRSELSAETERLRRAVKDGNERILHAEQQSELLERR